jgi:hypothetical protein
LRQRPTAIETAATEDDIDDAVQVNDEVGHVAFVAVEGK